MTPPLARVRGRTAALAWLLAVLVVVATIAVGAYFLETYRRPPSWTAYEPVSLFAPGSFWDRPLGADPPLASDSARLVRSFTLQIQGAYGHVAVNTTSYSAPVYVVGRHQPTVRVDVQACASALRDADAAAELRRVPIPADARPAAGTDHDLIVLQPSTGREWELWEAQDRGGRWSACNGGELPHLSTSDGVFPAPTGISASGLSILAGMIRLSDLRAGRIDHALEVAIPETAKYPVHVAPADRTDGYSTSPDAVPEGTRFRLAPDVDVASLHLTRLGEMVAYALQRYGMVVSDTSAIVSFQAQDPTPLTRLGRANPWTKLFGATPGYDLLQGIPWGDLEALAPSDS